MVEADISAAQVPYIVSTKPNLFNRIQDKFAEYFVMGIFAVILILVINYYIGVIFGKSPLAGIADAVNTAVGGVKKAVDTLKLARDRGIGVPLVCGADETNRVGLCYKSCKLTEDSDGTQRCYEKPPQWSTGGNWPGGKTITHIQHKVMSSPVGVIDTIPNGCSGGKQMSSSLCYDVPSDWKVTSPGFVGETCEKIQPGFTRDDGTGCWIDADTYGRGTGRDPGLGNCPGGWSNDGLTCREPINCDNFLSKGCTGGNITSRPANGCNSDEEKWGALCYPKCRSGYSPSGCCTCLRAANVKYRQIKSQIGTLPDTCPNGKELRGRLCYPKCQDNSGGNWPYERTDGNIENCTTKCPPGWKNIGIGGCERPFRDVGMGVPIHTCDQGMVNEVGLCYHPCTDIQSVKDDIKMNVGRTYTGIGPTCFPNL